MQKLVQKLPGSMNLNRPLQIQERIQERIQKQIQKQIQRYSQLRRAGGTPALRHVARPPDWQRRDVIAHGNGLRQRRDVTAHGNGLRLPLRRRCGYGSTRWLRMAKRISSLKLEKFIFFMM